MSAGHPQWVDVDTLTHPQHGPVDVYRDSWWVTNTVGQVCLWRFGPGGRAASPQCNTNPMIVDRLGKNLEGSAGTKVFLPLAFVPHRCDE